METRLSCPVLHKCFRPRRQGPAAGNTTINGELVIISDGPLSLAGLILASLRFYSNTLIDAYTGNGLLSEEVVLKNGIRRRESNRTTVTYQFEVNVVPEFGIPGAFQIENKRRHHKFFLESLKVKLQDHDDSFLHFHCQSWVYPIKKTQCFRLFFSNVCYLPGQEPKGLMNLREYELKCLRGEIYKDGHQDSRERKEWDRIYEYDLYNDLGDPDTGIQWARPVLGGASYPYPRRLKTARPSCTKDTSAERRPTIKEISANVPPDERLSPAKASELKQNLVNSIIYFLVPAEETPHVGDGIAQTLSKFGSCFLRKTSPPRQDDASFKSIDHIINIFSNRKRQPINKSIKHKLKNLVPEELFREIINIRGGGGSGSKLKNLNFPLPSIIAVENSAWRIDEEFARQALAGTNPTRIKCLKKDSLTDIKKWSGEVNNRFDKYNGYIKKWSGEVNDEDKVKVLILDHHDYLLPYLRTVQKSNVCAYASQTIFLEVDGILKPLAIKLSSSQQNFDVFVPPKDAEEVDLDAEEVDLDFDCWELAKAHVAANDSANHLLVSHWLHTHAVVEPFIIATRRQLSVMHPIHRLLDPHFKDTIHINAFARAFILNSGGILEKILFTGEISMELSSQLYKEWRFDEQALPKDLLKRNMARKSDDKEVARDGVVLILKDYPYADDGLDIWVAIKTWVTDYCNIFYGENDDRVKEDKEIQQWWKDIKHEGHRDSCRQCWYDITNLDNLITALTTLIWMTSGLHAAVNFGQFAYYGFPPNRPTMCRKFVPEASSSELTVDNSETYFLNMLPGREEMEIVMALTSFLSNHTSDEVYLGQRSEWSDNNNVVCQKFSEFKKKLEKIEKDILKRNREYKKVNRWGAQTKIPYKLLYPDTSSRPVSEGGIYVRGVPNSISTVSEGGITVRGVPNSISI